MVKMYYYLIKAGRITNIEAVSPRYRESVTAYIADYGYTVAEDGTITKEE